MYLVDNRIGDHWYPAKSKIVINATVNSEGKKFITFIVDPDYPNRWRQPPYFADIKVVAKAGIDGLLGEKWTTVVMIKDEKIPIIGSATLLRARE